MKIAESKTGRKHWKKEQFLLFPQCFQKTCTPDMLKPVLVWERVKVGFILSSESTKSLDKYNPLANDKF